NIGFAIPINVVKDLIENFQKIGGNFERPYLGVRYKMIDKQTAILNDVVEGAYIIAVIENSPAQKAGLQEEDIIIEFDHQKIKGSDDQELAKIIFKKKVGEQLSLKIWRNGQTLEKTVVLESMK
ncbi:MAG: S1C family serine protease, partial [Patescibacteria group bacterium]|nr:S1C family serine protease [Patescibacteria group bacterium]